MGTFSILLSLCLGILKWIVTHSWILDITVCKGKIWFFSFSLLQEVLAEWVPSGHQKLGEALSIQWRARQSLCLMELPLSWGDGREVSKQWLTVISSRKAKAGLWRAPLNQSQLGPFTGGWRGWNEAETTSRRRRNPCKGLGAERSRTEQTSVRPPGAPIEYLRHCHQAAHILLESLTSGTLSLPAAAPISLCWWTAFRLPETTFPASPKFWWGCISPVLQAALYHDGWAGAWIPQLPCPCWEHLPDLPCRTELKLPSLGLSFISHPCLTSFPS